MQSNVEKNALKNSNQELQYSPEEQLGIIVVDNFPALGNLTSLRFIEWVQENPEGVISLPTGKTPEFFIKETERLLSGWKTKAVQKELEDWGIDTKIKPEMKGLQFVQIDEFYPINPAQHNSFYYYINKFYMEKFGLDPDRALLINSDEIPLPGNLRHEDVWGDSGVDLSLRYRSPVNKHEKLQRKSIHSIDQWCVEYEDRIREKGGLGFFLGGIGPDGHIGFNIHGADIYSTTRLTQINYETQAAAAGDLGGIEVARKSSVITLSLIHI